MKLRNKKTGVIAEFVGVSMYNGMLFYRFEDENGVFKIEVNSLAELNEEWCDYEEPKGYWFINEFGTPTEVTHTRENIYDKSRKNFGNYFETKEEAEQAVEKHKAWARLKAKGFTWQGWEEGAMDNGMYIVGFQIPEENWETDVVEDLDICFGGED